jgi:hypothetical protein
MLLMMLFLAPRFGIQGIAVARLGYAAIPLFLYIPLLRHFYRTSALSGTISVLRLAGEEQ